MDYNTFIFYYYNLYKCLILYELKGSFPSNSYNLNDLCLSTILFSSLILIYFYYKSIYIKTLYLIILPNLNLLLTNHGFIQSLTMEY